MNITWCEINDHIVECDKATGKQYALFGFSLGVVLWIIFCFLFCTMAVPYSSKIYNRFASKKTIRYVTGINLLFKKNFFLFVIRF
jgi:hypothetical protein